MPVMNKRYYDKMNFCVPICAMLPTPSLELVQFGAPQNPGAERCAGCCILETVVYAGLEIKQQLASECHIMR
jgi:hypothetical protein